MMLNNKSKTLFLLQILLIFCIALFANYFTFLSRDDFNYIFHCKTLEPLHTLPDYFSSVAYNTKVANGRYLGHFFAQVFLNAPKWVFNIINSLFYSMQVFLCYRLCNIPVKSENNTLFLGIFGASWVFEPLFGDVNLWLTGSCNYLWAIVVTLAFILPFYRLFITGEKIKKPWVKLLFIPLGFLAGAWSEGSSSAALLFAFIILVLSYFPTKSLPDWCYIASFASGVLGFASLIFSPVELSSKVSVPDIYMTFQKFKYCLEVYSGYSPLLLVLICLFVISSQKRGSRKYVISSLVFFAVSVFSNFIFMFASYYPGRCAATSSIYLIISIGILVGFLDNSGEKQLSTIIPLLIIPSLVSNLIFGLDDIRLTNYTARQVASYIDSCKANGIYDVKYPLIASNTTYTIYYSDLPYQIDTDSPDGWPNFMMAKYFGVDRITGVDSVEEISEIPPIM